MRITKVELRRFKAPLKRPFQTALRRVEALEDWVIVLVSDEGLTGYGEGAPTPQITGETMETMQAAITHLAPFVTGRELETEFDAILQEVHSAIVHHTTAKAALEIALYDLLAQKANLPLYRFLGGSQKDFVTDITISLDQTKSMIEEAIIACDQGYRILKLKVGGLKPSEEIARIIAIHEAIGQDIALRLDANQAWEPDVCIKVMSTLEGSGVFPELIEQPVPAWDIKGLRTIKERIETPVLADESLVTPRDAHLLLSTRAVDLLNIKLSKCGGISRALQIADIATSYGAKCMIGCMLEGPLSIAAALHVASARSGTITMLDLDAVSLCRSHPADGSLRLDTAKLRLDDSLGLGMRFDALPSP
jgi:L-Ala-D/L-Glu epimerase